MGDVVDVVDDLEGEELLPLALSCLFLLARLFFLGLLDFTADGVVVDSIAFLLFLVFLLLLVVEVGLSLYIYIY